MQYHQYSGKLIRYYHAASWSERPHHAVSNSFEDRQKSLMSFVLLPDACYTQ